MPSVKPHAPLVQRIRYELIQLQVGITSSPTRLRRIMEGYSVWIEIFPVLLNVSQSLHAITYLLYTSTEKVTWVVKPCMEGIPAGAWRQPAVASVVESTVKDWDFQEPFNGSCNEVRNFCTSRSLTLTEATKGRGHQIDDEYASESSSNSRRWIAAGQCHRSYAYCTEVRKLKIPSLAEPHFNNNTYISICAGRKIICWRQQRLSILSENRRYLQFKDRLLF